MRIKFKNKSVLDIKKVILKTPHVWVVVDVNNKFYLVSSDKIENEE